MRNTLILIFAFTLFVFAGCTKDSNQEIQQENILNKKLINNNVQEYQTFNEENNDIGYLNASEIVNTIENIEVINQSNYENEEKETLISSELNPFTHIGSNVVNYIIENHDVSDPSFGLTDEEHLILINPRDEDLAIIGFILNLANTHGYETHGWTQDEILDCLAVAVGIKGIYDLVVNTKSLAAFGEVVTAKQAVRLLGKIGSRYLGWIGVALMVRDFANCMSNLE